MAFGERAQLSYHETKTIGRRHFPGGEGMVMAFGGELWNVRVMFVIEAVVAGFHLTPCLLGDRMIALSQTPFGRIKDGRPR